MSEDGKPNFKCTICGKQVSVKTNLRNHIESAHFPGHFSYNCKYCGKTFKSKNSLCNHVSIGICLHSSCIYPPVPDFACIWQYLVLGACGGGKQKTGESVSVRKSFLALFNLIARQEKKNNSPQLVDLQTNIAKDTTDRMVECFHKSSFF